MLSLGKKIRDLLQYLPFTLLNHYKNNALHNYTHLFLRDICLHTGKAVLPLRTTLGNSETSDKFEYITTNACVRFIRERQLPQAEKKITNHK